MYAIWDIALANFAKSRQGLWRKMRQNLIGTVIYIRAMYLRVTLFSRVYHEIFFIYVSRQSVCIDLPSSRLNLTALLLRKYEIWDQKFAIYKRINSIGFILKNNRCVVITKLLLNAIMVHFEGIWKKDVLPILWERDCGVWLIKIHTMISYNLSHFTESVCHF